MSLLKGITNRLRTAIKEAGTGQKVTLSKTDAKRLLYRLIKEAKNG